MSIRTYAARKAHFSEHVQRLLPQRELRTIGPWCFFDHFGPAEDGGFVRPHPHVGLQTVTWLFSGQGRHGDNLGHQQIIRPGQLNLMTAAEGIVHWEDMDNPTGEPLHGVQLWLALPDAHRQGPAGFEHLDDLPRADIDDAECLVFLGDFAGASSPASTHWPLCGVEVRLPPGGSATLPLDPDWEYGISVVEGRVSALNGEQEVGQLVSFGPGDLGEAEREALSVQAGPDGARMILIGGAPFEFPVLIWWNFVARSPDEIGEAAGRWPQGFGDPAGWEGDPMSIPNLPRLSMPTQDRPRD